MTASTDNQTSRKAEIFAYLDAWRERQVAYPAGLRCMVSARQVARDLKCNWRTALKWHRLWLNDNPDWRIGQG